MEAISRLCDWTDRSTCVLFGDGAGAAVVDGGEGGLMATLLLSLNELLSIVENLGEIGVPMPKPLVDALHKLGEQDHFQEE